MGRYPYDRTSNPVGKGTLTAADIDKSFAVKVGAAIIDACARLRLSDGSTIDSDLAAGQCHLETGGGTSAIFKDKNNPGGIGAENDNPYGGAIKFPTLQAGVDAFIAGLITYNDPNPRPEIVRLDPRYDIRKDAGYVGIVQREDKALYEYEQRYAWTEDAKYNATPVTERYGAKIAKRTNEIVIKAGKIPAAVPIRGRIPKPAMNAAYRSPNTNQYSAAEGMTWPMTIEAVVHHISEGGLASNLSWLTNSASGASSNYLIARDGTIYELVPLGIPAWTNGPRNKPNLKNPLIKTWNTNGWNPNTRTVTIEHQGYTSYGAGGSLTPAQRAASILLTAWLLQEIDKPADRTHIIGHYEIDSVERPNCPGYSPAEWDALVHDVDGLLGGIVASSVAYPANPKIDRLKMPDLNPEPFNGKLWPYCFIDFYNQRGGWQTFGLVKTGVFIEDGKLVAYTERWLFEYQPAVDSWVEGALLGNMRLDERYHGKPPA